EDEVEEEQVVRGSSGQRLADSDVDVGADNHIGGVDAGMRVTRKSASGADGGPLTSWGSRSVRSALWSYAALRCHPGNDFIWQVCRHLVSERHLRSLSVRDLIQCVWALATFRQLERADAEGGLTAVREGKHRSQCCTAALAAMEREVVVRLKTGRAGLVDETQEGDRTQPLRRRETLAEAEVEAKAEVATRFGNSSGSSNGSSRHLQARMEGPEGGEGQGKPSSRLHRELLRPQHVADLLWSYATLEHPAPDLFTTLLPLLEHQLAFFSNAAMSRCTWAAAALGVYDSRFMDAVADNICSHRLPYLKPQELASSAWAYGELGHAHKTLFDGLVSYTVSYVWPRADRSMTLREISTVCAAAGVFGWRYPVLTDAAARVLARLLIPMGQWGHLRDKHGTAFARDSHSRCQPASAIPPTGLASIGLCSTTATAGASGSDEASAAAAAMAVTQHCTRSVSVHYENNRPASSAVSSTSGSSSSNNNNSTGDGNGTTPAPATTTARTTTGGLGPGAALLLLPSEHDVAALSWGFSLVGGCSPEMWAQLMELMGRVVEEEGDEGEKEKAGGARGGGGKGLSDEALARMCQAYLHMRLDYPTAALSTGPMGLLRRGAEVLRRQQQQQNRCACGADGRESSGGRNLPGAVQSTLSSAPSNALPMPTVAATMMQSPSPSSSSSSVSCVSAVSEALSRLGLSHTVQSLTEDGLFRIDLAVEVEVRVDTRGRSVRPIRPTTTENTAPTSPSTTQIIRIAVEVDGPRHFTANTRQPLSPTLYRRRCLEDRGWVVVSVPYWRWNQCRTATSDGATSSGPAEQEEALLLQLMREEGLGEVIEAVKAQPPPPPARQRRRRIQKALKVTASGKQQLQLKPDDESCVMCHEL
ncbi:hypothetical protein VaNZ11_016362, partial [Volvox africanus]